MSTLQITKDTVIIGINSDDKAGVEGAVPTIAIETDKSGVYQANAYYVMGTGDEVKLLVVDTYGNIPAVDSSSDLSGAVDQTAIQDALNKYTDVTLNANAITGAASVKVPAGATLTVSDTSASNALTVEIAKGATLKVEDTSITADKLVVKAVSGSTLVVPNGTLIGDAMTIEEGTLTLTANGSGMKAESSDAVVKVNKDVTIGGQDALNLTGSAKIIGTDGVKLTINGTVTNVSGNNFYDDKTNATPETATKGNNYTWTTFQESGTSTTITGWLKN